MSFIPSVTLVWKNSQILRLLSWWNRLECFDSTVQRNAAETRTWRTTKNVQHSTSRYCQTRSLPARQSAERWVSSFIFMACFFTQRPLQPCFFLVLSTMELRNMIRQSDIEGLEQVILDGHGQKLLGENAADNKIRAFIKAVPSYLVLYRVCFPNAFWNWKARHLVFDCSGKLKRSTRLLSKETWKS